MRTEPFSSSAREVYVGRLDSEHYFAFNFGAPRGVAVLSKRAVARLGEWKHGTAEPTSIESAKLDADLAKRGLIPTLPVQFQSPPKPEGDRRFTVWLHVTNACNFGCHYCYIPHLNRTINPESIARLSIPKSSISPLLAKLVTFCERNGLEKLQLKFAGGEPTLNLPLIEALCSEATTYDSSVKISFSMLSNGSFDTQTVGPILKKFNIALSISADGIAESHDRIRRSIDKSAPFSSWDKIETVTRELLNLGIHPYFLYTVTSGNLDQVSAFSDWCHSKKLGFRLSLVRNKIPPTRALQERAANMLTQFYARLGHTLPVDLRLERHARFSEWNLSKIKHSACATCRNYVAVAQNGDVSSCQMTMNTPHGNILLEPMENILSKFKSDPNLQTLANPDRKSGACLRCQFFHVCSGGCPQHTSHTFGNPDGPSPWCEVYGAVAPVYIEAVARHLLRRAVAAQIAGN